MVHIERVLKQQLEIQLDRGKSILLLGARQTGKSTLLKQFDVDIIINLMDTQLRRRYEENPGLLAQEVRLRHETQPKLRIFIDEIQKVPELLDDIQVLIDDNIAQFILTGSSARKLRQPPVNLLPGRVVKFQLDPLTLAEIDAKQVSLEKILLYGLLPGIFLQEDDQNKELDLRAYVDVYLEEEIRAEAFVRQMGDFSRFLALAAGESGYIMNMSKLAGQVGVNQKTIDSYFSILEDCLVAERIEPVTETKTRRRLVRSNRYLLYDLGVRRVAAHEGLRLPEKYRGHLFEQFIGQQLIYMLRQQNTRAQVKFWRDANGVEVDYVVEIDRQYIPIEVKWSEAPTKKSTKGCQIFMAEYDGVCPLGGFIICQTPQDYRLNEHMVAMSWRRLPALVSNIIKQFE